MLGPWNSSDVLLLLRWIFTVGWKAWQNVRWLMLSCMQPATALTMTNACLTSQQQWSRSNRTDFKRLRIKKKKKNPKCIERAENITHPLNVKLILPMNEFSSSLSNHLYSFRIKQRFTVKTQPRALSLAQNSTFASLEQSTTWATAAPCSHNPWPPRFLLLVQEMSLISWQPTEGFDFSPEDSGHWNRVRTLFCTLMLNRCLQIQSTKPPKRTSCSPLLLVQCPGSYREKDSEHREK